MSSGTVANGWAISDDNEHSEYLYIAAAELDQPKTSMVGLINFLKTVPAKKLIAYASQWATFYNTFDFPFSPVIES